MSIAWATILIILLLLPGVAFCVGYWAQERYARDIIKSTAVADVGLALLVAMLLHFIAWWILETLTSFEALYFFSPFYYYETTPPQLLVMHATKVAPKLLVYLVVLAGLGFVIGRIFGWLVMRGPLRGLATHKWAHDLVNKKRDQVVAAYVATTTKQDNIILMYSGYVSEFYLDAGGWFTHIVMRNCSSYYMKLGGKKPTTHERRKLFSDFADREWEHLVIPGNSITNVLFEPLGKFVEMQRGAEALEAALTAEARAERRRARPPSKARKRAR
jgi:NADH:ubiquinone oxidoreductase subunit 5 (subunit L)/multisubunit Na+/H+ antiporter MnhA subunit